MFRTSSWVYPCFAVLLLSACADEGPLLSEDTVQPESIVAVAEKELTGTVALRNRVSSLCLEAATSGSLPRPVIAAACRDSSTQRWRVIPSPGDGSVVRFFNSASGLCLDSNGARMLYTFGCNGGQFQQWFVSEVGRTIDFAVNEATGFCLDGSGSAARVENCNGSDAQRWSPVAGTTRTKYTGVIDHGGSPFEAERVDVVGGACTAGFTRITPPQLSHEGHGGCSFDGWNDPFDSNDCRAKIRVHDDAGWLRGHCNWAIFERN